MSTGANQLKQGGCDGAWKFPELRTFGGLSSSEWSKNSLSTNFSTARRMSMLGLASMIFATFFAYSASAKVNVQLPVPQQETLPNGLQLVWFLSDHLPVIDLALMVKSGDRDAAGGKSGTAELVAATLDRGAAGMTAQQVARATETLGATRYAASDEDTFSIGMHGLAPDAPVLLELLAKIGLRPDFPEIEVKREHARLLDRWHHLADYGETLVSVAFHRQLTNGTSYARGSFWSAKEFRGVTREDVVGFHKKHFTPKNAVLMVVGRVDKTAFREQVLRLFGTPEAWTGEVPKRDWKKYTDKRLPVHKKGAILLVDRPSLTQAQVRMGFQAPPLTSPDHYALVVANALLGEYFNSRLNALIRDKLGLTYGIGSSFAYSKDFSSFTITSSTRNESVGQLIHKSIDVLKDLRRGPVPAEEVQMAKEYLQGGFPLGTATLSAVASRWLSGYIFDRGPGYLNEFVPMVESVTVEQVIAAVVKYLDPSKLIVTVVGDAKEVSKSLAEASLKPVLRVTVDQLM